MLLAFHIVPWNSLFLGVHTKLGWLGCGNMLMKAFTGYVSALILMVMGKALKILTERHQFREWDARCSQSVYSDFGIGE